MRTTRVHVDDPHDVYCGRPSDWGNPFSHKVSKFSTYKTKNAEDSVEQFRKWLRWHPELVEKAKTELKGKRLACFCRPDAVCHVDVWIEVVDG